MSKQIYDTVPTFPFKDYVTGTEIGPFVDTGKTVRFDRADVGRIYLAKSTVAELASDLGLSEDPEERDRALAAAYNRGKLDAALENLSGDTASVLRRLADALDGSDVRVGGIPALGTPSDPQ